MDKSRPALEARLDAFVSSTSTTAPAVLVVSAPPGSGKSTALRVWGKATRVFEFQALANATALDCVLAAVDLLSPPAASAPSGLLPVKRAPPMLDARRIVAQVLPGMAVPPSLAAPVVFCVDAPERGFRGDLILHLLLAVWPECVFNIKLVVLTSLAPVDLPAAISPRIELITRVCAKPVDADEGVAAYFRSVLADELHVDPEWTAEVVDLATKRAASSFYYAAFAVPILKALHRDDKLFAIHLARALPASLEAAIKTKYQPWMGAFLVAKDARLPKDVLAALMAGNENDPNAQTDLALVVRNGGRDWFARLPAELQALDGHGLLARALQSVPASPFASAHVLHHLCECGNLAVARGLLLSFESLSRLCVASADNLVRDAARMARLLPDDAAVRVLAGTLRLALAGLKRDALELRGQLLGRLALAGLSSDVKTALASLVEAAKAPCGYQAWVPVRPTLQTWPEQCVEMFTAMHSDTILCASVAAGDDVGGVCATGSVDGTAQVFSLSSGACLFTLEAAHAGFVSGVCVSHASTAASTRVLTGHQDGIGRLWFAEENEAVQVVLLIGHEDVITSACFQHPGAHTALTTSCDRSARVWSLPARADGGDCVCTAVLRGHEELYAAVFVGGAAATTVVTADGKGEVRLWSVSGDCLAQLPSAHFAHVAALAVSPSGAMLASAAWECNAKLWALRSAVPQDSLGDAAGGDDDAPAVWMLDPVASLVHRDWVWACAFVDNARVATATDSGDVRVWSTRAPFACVASLAGHAQGVYCLAVARGGRVLVTAGLEAVARAFVLPTDSIYIDGAPARERVGGAVAAVAFVRNRDQTRYAFLAAADRAIHVWDLETSRLAKSLEGHALTVTRLRAARDGSKVTSRDDDQELTWDAARLEAMSGSSVLLDCLCGPCRATQWEDDSALVVSRAPERVVTLGRGVVGLTLDGACNAWADARWMDYVVAVDASGFVHVLHVC